MSQPTEEQVPLFDTKAEPKSQKADWMLAVELHGAGTLDKDVYLVWRIVHSRTANTQTLIVKYLTGQCEWDDKRAERAVNRAIGARAITYAEGGILKASDCEHLSRTVAS